MMEELVVLPRGRGQNLGCIRLLDPRLQPVEPEKVSLVSRSEKSTWYGQKTYTTTWVKETHDQTIATHSVKGDHGIAVNFLGSATADIEIDSKFGGSVLIAGPILNSSAPPTSTPTAPSWRLALRDG